MGGIGEAWRRFWRLSLWIRALAIGGVVFIVLIIVVAVGDGDDGDGEVEATQTVEVASTAPTEARTATALPQPLTDTSPPLPTPTPDLAAVARRDDQRRQDLATIAAALQRYHDRHEAYPLAVGLQSFCRYRNLDAGCKVIEVLDPLPQDPSPPRTYWYWSDGTTFILFAGTEGPAGPALCPEPLPVPFRDADTTYCLPGRPEAPP